MSFCTHFVKDSFSCDSLRKRPKEIEDSSLFTPVQKRHKMIEDSSILMSEPFDTNDSCQRDIGKYKYNLYHLLCYHVINY